MSTPQRNGACRIPVDPSTADVLRLESKKVAEFNHEYFEDFLEYGAEAQYALSMIFRDAFAVVDAVGWDRDPQATETIEVPLTDGHIEQLRRRRYDLGATNLDRLDDLDQTVDDTEAAAIREAITVDRLAAQTLDRLFGAYGIATRT